MKGKRIFIGLGEIVGIGITYAEALQKLGYTVTYVTDRDDMQNRQYKSHDCLNIHQYKNSWMRSWIRFRHFLFALFEYDYFLFIFGKSLLPQNYDLPVLKFFGKKIGVVFLGCDLRQRYKVAQENRPSAFCDECNAECGYIEKDHKVKMFERYAHFIVAQEEYAQMLTKDFHYCWMPIDLTEWQDNRSYTENPCLKIVHAPSHRAKKGTKYILEAVEKLRNEGFNFEFQLLENIPNTQLKEYLSGVDIVIDQVMGGWYGKLSVESMALSKVVLTWIYEPFQKNLPDLPIINTSKEQLYERLRMLLENPALRKETALAGRHFVEKYHDASKVVQELIASFER